MIQGINKDTLDGTVLHFPPVDANVTLLDSWNPMGKGYYGKIFMCRIFGIDFIPKHKIYVCKIFTIFDEGDAITSKNKEAIDCPLSHPTFVKIFATHSY